jgi:hypothetical protein
MLKIRFLYSKAAVHKPSPFSLLANAVIIPKQTQLANALGDACLRRHDGCGIYSKKTNFKAQQTTQKYKPHLVQNLQVGNPVVPLLF